MKWFVRIVVAFIVIVGLTAAAAFWYVHHTIYSPQGTGVAVVVDITTGEGSVGISQKLQDNGVVKNAWIFRLYLYQTKLLNRLQAGSYELSPQLTMPEIAKILTGGDSITTDKTVTLREGLRRQQVADLLAQSNIVDAQSFMDATADASKWDYPFLSAVPAGQSLEGYLFPDTYRFAKDATANDIVKRMLDNFGKKTAAIYSEAQAAGSDFHDVVTLASIVEKEVSVASEQGLVAGVFQNRLAVGMPLQSDVTINFAMGDDKVEHSIAETQIDNPYNTYKYKGLPPGPIASPGLSALDAALHPTKSDYYYFLSTKTGEMIFSKTLDQHNAAKRKYLK